MRFRSQGSQQPLSLDQGRLTQGKVPFISLTVEVSSRRSSPISYRSNRRCERDSAFPSLTSSDFLPLDGPDSVHSQIKRGIDGGEIPWDNHHLTDHSLLAPTRACSLSALLQSRNGKLQHGNSIVGASPTPLRHSGSADLALDIDMLRADWLP
ncbi:hypothetical protein CCHR01_17793 [Colletotrichum chrysophilum]|uniref:Uncharacterized protein n=1 Tax=Colletotrichum chrysophilum TaxID=1836956 RepID=A0AAD9EC55_9PEZI|nr:hypothetical protein CCHR01_17793 [Colletotrichum chrysophilum]